MITYSSKYWKNQIAFMWGLLTAMILFAAGSVLYFGFFNRISRLLMYSIMFCELLVYPSVCIMSCSLTMIWVDDIYIYSTPVYAYHRDFVQITRALLIFVCESIVLEALNDFSITSLIMLVIDLCLGIYVFIRLLKVFIRLYRSKLILCDALSGPDIKRVSTNRHIYCQIVSGIEGICSGIKKHLIISNEPFILYSDKGYNTLREIEKSVYQTDTQIYAPYDVFIMQAIQKANAEDLSVVERH